MNRIKRFFVKIGEMAVHRELLYQLEGLISIELNKYLYNAEESNNIPHYEKDSLELVIDMGGDGLDIYVLPGTEKLTFENTFDNMDKYMVGHYHPDDLLYLILNWEKEKQYLIDKTSVVFFDYYFNR